MTTIPSVPVSLGLISVVPELFRRERIKLVKLVILSASLPPKKVYHRIDAMIWLA